MVDLKFEKAGNCMLRTIEDLDGINRLVQDLRRGDRLDPIVVISTHRGNSRPYINAESLAEELSGMAVVAVLTEQMWLTFGEQVGGKKKSTFPGGVRIYPAGAKWDQDNPSLNLQCHGSFDEARVKSKVIERVQALNYLSRPVAPSVGATGRECVAIVDNAINETQVLVKIGHRDSAMMLAVELWPGVSASRLVRRGQEIRGKYETGTILGKFVPDPIPDDVRERAMRELPDGTVSLARVLRSEPEQAILELHPKLAVTIDAEMNQDLTLILIEGDIIQVELVWEGDFCVLAYRDDADPQGTRGLSLLPGGPPWLELQEAEISVGQHEEESQTGPPPENESLISTDEAQVIIELLKAENSLLRKENSNLSEKNAQSRRALRNAQKSFCPIVYANAEEQFRFEIMMSHLVRIDEDTRRRKPLPERFLLGQGFLKSVDTLTGSGGIKRDKIVDVCAEVLSGLAEEITSRGVKAWTVGANGTQECRPSDQARAFRVRLQTSTAGARRLKYWKHLDGTIEIDSVSLHDEGID